MAPHNHIVGIHEEYLKSLFKIIFEHQKIMNTRSQQNTSTVQEVLIISFECAKILLQLKELELKFYKLICRKRLRGFV